MFEKMTENFVGSKQLVIKDEIKNVSFPVTIQYPTLQTARPTAFGPYIMDVSVDAKIIDGKFPLVIISHGSGGSPLLYRTITTNLAKNGFVVAMVEHYGNNRMNNELEGKDENFTNRLRHISLVIDFMFSSDHFKEHLQPNNVAMIGHSIGANTALVLAGGIPISYADYQTKFGKPIHAGQETQEMQLNTDGRIKAIVLLALTPGWFTGEESLEKVNIPVLVINAEKDIYIPNAHTEQFFEKIKTNSNFSYQSIKNAGHFSFLSPFPATMKNPNFLPSTDPEGFDREQFHKLFPTEVLEFLYDKLKQNSN
jgi:predicted dienelactone hydrolase